MSNMKDTFVPPLKTTIWSHEENRAPSLGGLFSVQTLKQAALRIADVRRGTGFQTRDLVGLLVSHAARNKRIAQPRARMRMTLPVNSNTITVRVTIEN
ncbi:hypothetical protein ACFSE0_13565 [Ochrobactrum teleogrylli]|uniref:Uncharacterized protein n=1 Tax=Ochrobactrum teleogrylli TaxID=2479765 RepID=A0ABY2Y3Z5_9HYPH|nr:hypothetical protein [[Ochrobactrum] teleogrylli]TNV16027.1 hypothetical protein FIC94_12235 [[Ochrobactrum] teleogrylli]